MARRRPRRDSRSQSSRASSCCCARVRRVRPAIAHHCTGSRRQRAEDAMQLQKSTTRTMPSSAPTKLAAMLSTWTDGSDGPLLEALFGSLTANAAVSRKSEHDRRCASARRSRWWPARVPRQRSHYVYFGPLVLLTLLVNQPCMYILQIFKIRLYTDLYWYVQAGLTINALACRAICSLI